MHIPTNNIFNTPDLVNVKYKGKPKSYEYNGKRYYEIYSDDSEDTCDFIEFETLHDDVTVNLKIIDINNRYNISNIILYCGELDGKPNYENKIHSIELSDNDTQEEYIYEYQVPTKGVHWIYIGYYHELDDTIEEQHPYICSCLFDLESYTEDSDDMSPEMYRDGETSDDGVAWAFAGCDDLTELNLTEWNTRGIYNMYGMFYDCQNLETIYGINDLYVDDVKDVRHMFHNCRSITNLDLTSWTWGEFRMALNGIDGMFMGMTKLASLKFPNGGFGQVFSLDSVFCGCHNLVELNVSDWWLDLYIAYSLFCDCRSLTTLDLSTWDIGHHLQDTRYMFKGCSSLVTLDLSGWDFSKVTKATRMFDGCTSLETIYVKDCNQATIDKLNELKPENCKLVKYKPKPNTIEWENVSISTTNPTSKNYSCGEISFAYSYYDPSNGRKMTGVANMSADAPGETYATIKDLNTYQFDYMTISGTYNTIDHGYEISYLYSLNMDDIDFTKISRLDSMFSGLKYLNSLTLPENIVTKDKGTSLESMFEDCYSLSSSNSMHLDTWDTSNVTDMQNMFYKCNNLTSLDVSGWDTSNVTNMRRLFYNCNSLTSLDLSNWDTSNVTDIHEVFSDCTKLTELDVSGWDTSKVTSMSWVFNGCNALTSLDVSGWDTSNVTNMRRLFYKCYNLTSLDLSNWNTSKVTIMKEMFYECYNLTSLDLSNWDTSKVTSMNIMFGGCSALTSLDLSNWNTYNVTDMSWMFYKCNSLTSLDVSGWNMRSYANIDYLFIGTNLKSISAKNCSQTTLNKIQNALEEAKIYDCVIETN